MRKIKFNKKQFLVKTAVSNFDSIAIHKLMPVYCESQQSYIGVAQVISAYRKDGITYQLLNLSLEVEIRNSDLYPVITWGKAMAGGQLQLRPHLCLSSQKSHSSIYSIKQQTSRVFI